MLKFLYQSFFSGFNKAWLLLPILGLIIALGFSPSNSKEPDDPEYLLEKYEDKAPISLPPVTAVD